MVALRSRIRKSLDEPDERRVEGRQRPRGGAPDHGHSHEETAGFRFLKVAGNLLFLSLRARAHGGETLGFRNLRKPETDIIPRPRRDKSWPASTGCRGTPWFRGP